MQKKCILNSWSVNVSLSPVEVDSTGSSDDSADYDGDVECPLLSESEQIIETFLEEPLKEREEPPNVNCQYDSQEEERTSEGTRFSYALFIAYNLR